jgi:DNA-directed RNA polymerase specialized sigma24 family protein
VQTQDSVDPICVHAGPLVDRVRQGDSAGVEELRRLLIRGLRFLVARKLPASQGDGCVDEVIERVIRGIQRGDLGNPLRLGQYVRMHLTTRTREIQQEQMPIEDPSSLDSASCERRKIMQDLLLCLSPGERESLVHFYVQGHDEERICRELRMPAAEFRALRVRVKARFHELC